MILQNNIEVSEVINVLNTSAVYYVSYEHVIGGATIEQRHRYMSPNSENVFASGFLVPETLHITRRVIVTFKHFIKKLAF